MIGAGKHEKWQQMDELCAGEHVNARCNRGIPGGGNPISILGEFKGIMNEVSVIVR